MADRLGIGIIGTGRIANSHMKAMQRHEPSNVIAVMDVVPGKAERFAEEYGITRSYTNLPDLLANKEIDAVIVATPPFAHMQPTLDALASGRYVLCEKPFSLIPAEAERMVEAAEKSGKFLAVCSARNRLTPGALRGHEMVINGELGHVYHGRSSSFRLRGRPGIDMFQDAPWFIDKQRAGGGALIDIGVYQIDTLLWLMGNPRVKSVLASSYMGIGAPATGDVKQSVEDHAVVTCLCDNGATAIIEIAWSSNITGANLLMVLGTEAGIRLNPLTKITAGEDRKAVETPVIENEPAPQPGLGQVTVSFVDDILAGRQPMTPARDALEVTRVIDAAYRSAETGQAVNLA